MAVWRMKNGVSRSSIMARHRQRSLVFSPPHKRLSLFARCGALALRRACMAAAAGGGNSGRLSAAVTSSSRLTSAALAGGQQAKQTGGNQRKRQALDSVMAIGSEQRRQRNDAICSALLRYTANT